MKRIDDFLNNITMYRLTLYFLICLLAVASLFSLMGLLQFNIINLLFSTIFLVVVSVISNSVFSKTFTVPTNVESVYITALILALIINPAKSLDDFIFLFWAGTLAIASKYIFAVGKKHIFNPAAISLAVTAFSINQSASWWVGNLYMFPAVLIGGLLIVRKIKRYDLVFSCIFTAIALSSGFAMLKGADLFTTLQQTVFYSPILFFTFVMLTEPLTTPPTSRLQSYYGVLVGFLSVPQIHFGPIYSTPELSLIIGNIFSYLVSPKIKLLLTLKEKVLLAPDIYDFVFSKNGKLNFLPGQYMEWTFKHENPDNRGNRRYFTLSSSPTENEIRVGIKFHDNSSSYKKSMLALSDSQRIVVSQLSGEFVLSTDINRKYVFIAGGIGITPFRSMIKYLLDNNDRRPITLFYVNRKKEEIVYKDVFDMAQEKLDIKIIYMLTDKNSVPSDWKGKTGYIDENLLRAEVPDYKSRYYYLSGPRSLTTAYEDLLKNIGLSKEQIITDYFPGFA